MVNSKILPRFAFEYGPILLAAIGPWNNTLVVPATSNSGGIYFNGVDPTQPQNWLILDYPLPGYTMSYSATLKSISSLITKSNTNNLHVFL